MDIDEADYGIPITLPADCSACGAPLSEGSFSHTTKKEYGACAVLDWDDETEESTVRCLRCFTLIYRHRTVTRHFRPESS